jgi:hypothetical protein
MIGIAGTDIESLAIAAEGYASRTFSHCNRLQDLKTLSIDYRDCVVLLTADIDGIGLYPVAHNGRDSEDHCIQ